MSLEKELRTLRNFGVMLHTKLLRENCDMLDFFVLKCLSPTRDQGSVGACGHCSTITAIEMLFRIADIRVNDSQFYCFDVVDLFDHSYRACRDVDAAARLRLDVSTDFGSSLDIVMSFVRVYGLKAVFECTNPRPRNLHAVFSMQERKFKIGSYNQVASSEVLQYVKHHPIMGTMFSHTSFLNLETVLYDGPNQIEIEDKDSKARHAVLIVGCLKIKRNDTYDDFLIVQNSHGPGFGFLGFLVMPFDCQNIFIDFLAPIGPIVDEHASSSQSSSGGKDISGSTYKGQSWPTASQNRDTVAIAKTGSRKTSGHLDEAVKILDLGFEHHIRKIVKVLPSQRQTLMYTATWPEEVQRIIGLLVNSLQVFSPMDERKRLEQISAKKICDLAGNLTDLVGAAAIHGDKSQGHVLSQFLDGSSPVLISTDIVARGLDIRIGRTGQADATGVPCTFFYYLDSKHASELVKLLEGANNVFLPKSVIWFLNDISQKESEPDDIAIPSDC